MGALEILAALTAIVSGIYVLAAEPTPRRKLLGLIPLGFVAVPYFLMVVVVAGLMLVVATARTNRAIARAESGEF